MKIYTKPGIVLIFVLMVGCDLFSPTKPGNVARFNIVLDFQSNSENPAH